MEQLRKRGSSEYHQHGKLKGEVKDIDLRLDWDLDQTRIFLGFLYVGLLDELALFNRPLTAAEVALLRDRPGLLTSLKK
jgi:hypothetical protein